MLSNAKFYEFLNFLIQLFHRTLPLKNGEVELESQATDDMIIFFPQCKIVQVNIVRIEMLI